MQIDDILSLFFQALVKWPGGFITRTFNGIRDRFGHDHGFHKDPSDAACWLAGGLLWAVIIGVGWLIRSLAT